MKTITIILLLFVAQSPILKPGNYHATKPHGNYDREQNLIINPDGTFKRIYMGNEMCLGNVKKEVTGVWQQNADTLTLTDTMLFTATVKPTLKKIFGADDTAVIRITKFVIQKESKLHFISSTAGYVKPQQYPLPDYSIDSSSQK